MDESLFNANVSDEQKLAAIEKIRKNPFGMHIIASCISIGLKKKCNAKENDVIDVKFTIYEDDGKSLQMFFMWMDEGRCSVSKETFNKAAEELSAEIIKYMPEVAVTSQIVKA